MNRSLCIATLLLVVILAAPVFSGHAGDNIVSSPSPVQRALYDPDPNHLWNRLHAALFIRTAQDGVEYGFDSLDPLLWSATSHLLDGESHVQVIRVLDEFIDKHGEKLIDDPLKRAILQRDLWAVFDWAATRNRYQQVAFHPAEVTALTKRLATGIRRLALTKAQIKVLPDNYAAAVALKAFLDAFDPEKPDAAFLPSNLFQKDGPWVCVETTQGLPAPVHTREFGGRSVFLIFVNLPGGRAETLAYLQKLNDFPEPWIYDLGRLKDTSGYALMPHSFDPKRPPWVNPDTPQFPVGTKFALVRQAVLIDSDGNLVPSHLTESVQMRVYRGKDYKRSDGGEQSVFEFKLLRQNLFSGKQGGLHAVEKEEKDFSVFLTHGIDFFEFQSRDRDPPSDPRGIALNCTGCHTGVGIHSVLSHSQLFSYPQTLRPPQYQDSSTERVGNFTAGWKRDQFMWGLLTGLWRGEN